MRGLFKFLMFFAVVGLMACGSDIENGNQLAGQRCYAAADCAQGLTCYERRCVPDPATSNNANNANNVNNANNANNVNNVNNVNNANNMVDFGLDMEFDLPPNCMPGDSVCLNTSSRAICRVSPVGTTEWVTGACPPDTRCLNGQCEGAMNNGNCIDRDGDGFGRNCPAGPDCNDNDARISPALPENCNTPFDDNCNGESNEGCEPTCCGGCADDQFCNAICECTTYDPSFCTSQDQPCLFEQQFSNGYICANFGGGTQNLRCIGICDRTVPNPASTCPGNVPAVCTFGDQNQGVCLSQCGLSEDPDFSCGQSGLACLPYGESDEGGVCVPSDPNLPIGAQCNPDEMFFGCADGAVCVQQGRSRRGICTQACRPFEYYTPMGAVGTDCDAGTHCLPFTPDVGVCRGDNNDVEGQSCFPGGSACQEDTVGCYPSFQGQTQCTRLCRLANGDSDCVIFNQECRQFDPQQTELGFCVESNP